MSKLGEIFISSRAPLSDAEFRQVRDKLEVLLAERNRARAVPVCEVTGCERSSVGRWLTESGEVMVYVCRLCTGPCPVNGWSWHELRGRVCGCGVQHD